MKSVKIGCVLAFGVFSVGLVGMGSSSNQIRLEQKYSTLLTKVNLKTDKGTVRAYTYKICSTIENGYIKEPSYELIHELVEESFKSRRICCIFDYESKQPSKKMFTDTLLEAYGEILNQQNNSSFRQGTDVAANIILQSKSKEQKEVLEIKINNCLKEIDIPAFSQLITEEFSADPYLNLYITPFGEPLAE